MFLTSIFRPVGFVLAALILALSVSCGGDSGEPAIPDGAARAVPAPSHLLIREPFFADKLAPLDELLAVDVDPFIYGPEAIEPGQYFRYTLASSSAAWSSSQWMPQRSGRCSLMV
jgi:hypothetical protein